MKTTKLLRIVTLAATLGLSSCQSEESTQIGENPNANAANSETAQNYQRASMADGSKDDFLDGNSCTKVLFPVNAIVNGQNVSLISDLDLSIVANILAEFNDDQDSVIFDFPITVQLSNYTEVTVNNQSEFNALQQECENASTQGKDAISCVDINFPVTMLTYNVGLEQTGSTVLESQESMFNFMSGLSQDELFSVNYPISATLSNGTVVQLESDADFKNTISDCLEHEQAENNAEEMAMEVEAILSNTTFKITSAVNAGVETTNDFAEYTVEFSNDLSLTAKNIINTTLDEIEGTYTVSSELDVFVSLNFVGNTAFNTFNNDWMVTTYSETKVVLQSKTDASTTLTFEEL